MLVLLSLIILLLPVLCLALLAGAKTDAMRRGMLGCIALTVLITAMWVWGGRAVLGILPPGTATSDAGWGAFETILGWPVMMAYVLVVTLLGYFINRHVQARINSRGA
ncbi:MAG: hypothetical protein ABW250_02540 [Pyrinomonadaceae bacterium]